MSGANIFDTKDYYEYYTRLQPEARNPKLPKPGYMPGLDYCLNPTENEINKQENMINTSYLLHPKID
jgi:hypothetical protein